MQAQKSKLTVLVFMGIFIALLPFLGFPRSLDNAILVVFGLLIALTTWWVRYRSFAQPMTQNGDDKKLSESGNVYEDVSQ